MKLPPLKPRKRVSHKGQNGHVLVIGGSEDYIGAPALVGMAALAVLRSGADLVTVAAPAKVAWAINCISPDIITKKIQYTNTTGNAGMTHGGTGDVLAGIIAGLVAQGNDLLTSARVATYANGKAAELLHKKRGFGYLASDLVQALPIILKRFQHQT